MSKTLNTRLTITVPESRFDSNHSERFLRALAAAAGGYTVVEGDGGWTNGNGDVIEEEIVEVTVRWNDQDKEQDFAVKKAVLTYIVHLLNEGEEAVLVSEPVKSHLFYASDIPHIIKELA
jgi:hypothetical protein